MTVRYPRTALVFTVVYLVHVAYGLFHLFRVEGGEAWLCQIVFLVGLNALGFLVWVTAHRWIALINVLIHLVGTLGEAKNAFLAGSTLRVPVCATHAVMLVVFLLMYLRSE